MDLVDTTSELSEMTKEKAFDAQDREFDPGYFNSMEPEETSKAVGLDSPIVMMSKDECRDMVAGLVDASEDRAFSADYFNAFG